MQQVRKAVFLFSFIVILPLMAQQQDIRICALRVDFVTDQSDLTTGNGKFMVDSVTTERFAIDPAPHNRLYFQDQILAAAHYYETVSHGRVKLTGTVFPAASDAAYHLPHEMGYYNPNTTDTELDLGLARLFKDALEVASLDSIDFKDFDLVVVIHAGVGRDVDVGYDSTPQDIPSLFISPEFLKNNFGSDFQGVDVGAGHFINSGIILPETENQDGYALALTGIFVSNIASHLGLKDLFSASDQRSGVGRFGLMDVGLMNMNGLIPSPPGAFSRHQLGWDQLSRIDMPQTDIRVQRLGASGILTPTIIQIPINEDEYYLIENRGDPQVDLDSLYAVLAQGREDLPTYLELLETYYGNVIEKGESGVLISVPDYDWGIPGAGVLIWHVDERIIRENEAAGISINNDPQQRAVDIEEADGSQDIGQVYSLLDAGYQKELGWFADFWFSNRPDYLEGFELYTNTFSATSTPNTNSNHNRAQSHITLTNFSSNLSEVMTFDFLRDWLEPGFPVSLFGDSGHTVAVVSGHIESYNDPYLFALSDTRELVALNAAGEYLMPAVQLAGGDLGKQGLVLADTDQNMLNDLLFAITGNRLTGFDLISKTIRFPAIDFGSQIISGPVAFADKIALGCANDTLYVLDKNGQILQRKHRQFEGKALLFDPSGALIDFPAAADYAVLAPLLSQQLNLITYAESTATMEIFSYPDLELRASWSLAEAPIGPLAIADVDQNGVYDILFNSADGIYALNRDGNLLSDFPLRKSLPADEHFVGSPLILDADNDEALDYLAATDRGNIFGFRADGRALTGFPLSTGSALSHTPIVLPFDEDPEMELLAVNQSGSVYSWQLAVRVHDNKLLWLEEFNTPANNSYVQQELEQKSVGRTLLPAARVFNYPNPNIGPTTKIRYYLNEPGRVKIHIFDATGSPIDDFEGPGNGGVDNEVVWNVADIASGVYLCRVEAKFESGSESRIIKIMVVH